MMIMDEAYVCSTVLYCQGEGCCAFSLVSNSYNNQVTLICVGVFSLYSPIFS